MADFQVFSPADGTVRPLDQVPDEAFAQRMLGDGLAIEPAAGFITAPFDGVVSSVHKALHAVTIKNEQAEVLIHVGVESVALQGKGFKALVKTGDTVHKGQKLTEFDPAFLAKNTPCNWVILVVTSPDGAAILHPAQGPVRAGTDVLFCLPGSAQPAAAAPAASTPDHWIYSRSITLSNPNGLHARPAAQLADAAKKFSFRIELEHQGRTADAKSLVAVMGLGLARGAQLKLRASDAQAAQALEQLACLLESGLHDGEEIPVPPEPAPQPVSAQGAVRALTACAGMASGPTWRWEKEDIVFETAAQDPAREQTRLQQALAAVQQDVTAEIAAAAQGTARTILQAHAQLLQDPFLAEQAAAQIQQGKSAEAAFNEAIRASVDILKNTHSRLLEERVADLKDLRRRVLLKLSGKTVQKPQPPQNCILLAEELLPSDVEAFDGRVCGVVLAGGSPTAHVSILLRNMGLPALVGAGTGILQIPNGTEAILHASQGQVYFDPPAPQRQQLQALMAQEQDAKQRHQQAAHHPAHTTEGHRVHVSGNASTQREAAEAAAQGADGLGLVRTEFMFYQSRQAPTEEEQYQLYRSMVEACGGQPVTLRTLDVGGDKPVSYLPLPAEANPMMGLRGIRTYGPYRDLFLTQIRAMLRAAQAGPVRIMLPMVTFVEELQHYKELILQEKQKLGLTAPVEIGIMVEVPAAALLAGTLAREADFFSIGTNDLTQYTLAIDRGHKTLCAQADPLHPAVLQLIGLTCRGAQTQGRPVGVCGAMAGELAAAALLVGLGVTELAVGAGAIASTKAFIRTLDRARCERVAAQALTLPHARAVRELVKQEFGI